MRRLGLENDRIEKENRQLRKHNSQYQAITTQNKRLLEERQGATDEVACQLSRLVQEYE
jgi:hypothetical protein